MKKYIRRAAAILGVCAVVALFIWQVGEFGVSKARLEGAIRSSQKIEGDWIVAGTASDTMAAYISYPQDKSDHTYSVYVTHPGLSFGYFFCQGGSSSEIDRGVAEYTVADCSEKCYISMNAQGINRVEIDDGRSVQTIDVDSGKPFAIVLPAASKGITFFDTDGAPVATY